MHPDTLFMDPLAEPVPPVSTASSDSAAPAVVFAALPSPEGSDDEHWSEPEISFRPRPSTEHQPGR